jgi:hypothetical protein
MGVALAITYHDPQGGLLGQLRRVLPILQELFAGIGVAASAAAFTESLACLEQARAAIAREAAPPPGQGPRIGRARRLALDRALTFDCPLLFYCDGDRLFHWADHCPTELAAVARRIEEWDFTVLGRTPGAFASHPRVQRDTEAIVNHVFSLATGRPWDLTAAARGLSRRAAESILAGCPDEGISTDVSWPLCLLGDGRFSLGYLETEGLAFETAERQAAEVAAAGGVEAWLTGIDADPRHWLGRLELARQEVSGIVTYWRGEALEK